MGKDEGILDNNNGSKSDGDEINRMEIRRRVMEAKGMEVMTTIKKKVA